MVLLGNVFVKPEGMFGGRNDGVDFVEAEVFAVSLLAPNNRASLLFALVPQVPLRASLDVMVRLRPLESMQSSSPDQFCGGTFFLNLELVGMLDYFSPDLYRAHSPLF